MTIETYTTTTMQPTTTPKITTSNISTTTTEQSSTTSQHSTTTTTSEPTTTEPPTTTAVISTTSTTEQSTTTSPHSTTTTTIPTTTTEQSTTPYCLDGRCYWTEWKTDKYPGNDLNDGDQETLPNITNSDVEMFCGENLQIECQDRKSKSTPKELDQKVTCNVKDGLICNNYEQETLHCYDYEIRVGCCICPYSTTTSNATTTSGKITTTKSTTTTEPPTTTAVISTTSTTEQSSTTSPHSTTTTTIPTTTTSKTTTPIIVTDEFRTTTVTQSPLKNDTTTKHLSATTVTNIASTTTKTTVTTITTTATTEQSTIATEKPTTTPKGCVCRYKNQDFKPGDLMFKNNDGKADCTEVYCSMACTFEKKTCYPVNCTYVDPPRKDGDTWISNCMTNKCEKGKIITEPVVCPSVKMPVCENRRAPVKVYDNGGCCFHYECRCVCSGWGDPHYVTFDGQYYSFQKNCTYVLVQEIIPKYNFTVLIDNENCDASGAVTCAKALIVKYKSYNVTLTAETFPKYKNTVYMNGKQIFPTYSNADLSITSTTVELRLRIPKIEAVVVFKSLQFSVELPFSLFHNNTEGQCGTCDNNTSNDCRLPNGQLRPCPSMAYEWHVPDIHKPYCEHQPTPTPITPMPSPPPPSPPCDVLMNGTIFEDCHKVIDPGFFYEACNYDVLYMNKSTGCSSLEAYASLCAQMGICVSWRNATNGLCDFNCPANQIYKPCGSTRFETCNARYNDKYISKCQGKNVADKDECQSFMEGCYCPDGLKRFSSNTDICVSACCTGPDGSPKEPGEKWQSGCQECVCDRDTMGVLCQPRPCPIPYVICDKEGEVMVNYTEDCCQQFKCECDRKRCDDTKPKCNPGYELKIHESNDSCCSQYACVPRNVCVFNDTEYEPGTGFLKEQCEHCICTGQKNKETMLNEFQCDEIHCQKNCSEGYVYEDKPGQCCGSCKKMNCVVTLRDSNSTVIIQPSKSWSPPDDPCTHYACKEENGELITTEREIECPTFDSTLCIPGTEQTHANGCCKTCKLFVPDCEVKKNKTHLEIEDCKSTETVQLSSCEGSCGASSSMYSAASNMMEHSCTCCREMKTSTIEVNMLCANGSTIQHSYISVDECGCHVSECEDASA